MDNFDRRLEVELAHLLDPIVAGPVPRRRRPGALRTLQGGLTSLPVETILIAEPVAVAAPAATLS